MKRLKIILSICLIFLLTGCLNYKVAMKVNDDKSMDFSLDQEIDMSSMKSMGNDTSSDNAMGEYKQDDKALKALKEKGFTVKENIDNENYKYSIKITKKYKSIDDISSKGKVTADFSKIFEKDFNEKFFKKSGNLYTANFKFAGDDSAKDMAAYANMFDISFVITLPNKAVSHNASEVSKDEKTLTWKLDISKTNNVNFSFRLGSSNYIAYIIGAILVVALVVGIVLVTKKKKNIPATS